MNINKDVIANLKPCKDRHDNYLKHYSNFNDDILKFLELEHITDKDKVWVAVRVPPRNIVEVFAIDCAFSAAAYTTVAAAAAAAYAAAAYAAYAETNVSAAYANATTSANANTAIARKEQVEVLKYLIKSERE